VGKPTLAPCALIQDRARAADVTHLMHSDVVEAYWDVVGSVVEL
jgi:hypothetical protein